jgi:choline dehydrogenase-like flavoprotein
MDYDSDLIIVGSGAGGSTAFFENLNLGKSCILIEEGKYSIDSFPDPDNITGVTNSLYRNGGILPAISKGGGKLMIAEGKAIGGGTEINGGLFWKTPKFILDDWVLRGFSNLDLVKFDEDLNLMLSLSLSFMDNWLQQSAEFVLIAIQNPTLSQEEIGVKLGINQAAVSRRQKRSNYELMMQVEQYFRKKS